MLDPERASFHQSDLDADDLLAPVVEVRDSWRPPSDLERARLPGDDEEVDAHLDGHLRRASLERRPYRDDRAVMATEHGEDPFRPDSRGDTKHRVPVGVRGGLLLHGKIVFPAWLILLVVAEAVPNDLH